MRKYLIKKMLVLGMIILFIGSIITPIISGNISEINDVKDIKTRDINNIIQNFAEQMVFIGHNIFNFDLRFIFQRMLINRIKPHQSLIYALNSKYDHERVFDIMIFWGGYSRDGWTSLDKMCKAFGIESSKTEDMDGSKVWDFIKAGDYIKVLDYNKRDVDRIRQLHKLMIF